MEKIIEVKSLSKSYDKQNYAIKELNFDILPGKFHVFIGSNGSGKTTTIKSIVGAYANYEGQILIGGLKNTQAEAKAKIAYMPENPNFPKELNLTKYIYSFGLLSGLSKNEAKKRAEEIIEKLNIKSFANKKPINFSSGEKRKALLAQCLISQPQLMIMDEPAANLDPESRRELFNILNGFVAQNRSIFISTHELHEVNRFTNYVTIIDKGNIVYSGDFNPLDDLEKFYFSQVESYYAKK
ncbi:ABC transporter ATP-binding protein [Mycoplasma sp. 128]